MRLGVLQALDVWLAEDLRPVEQQLVQRDAVLQLVQVYANAGQVRRGSFEKVVGLKMLCCSWCRCT
jgi:hypothetical protein